MSEDGISSVKEDVLCTGKISVPNAAFRESSQTEVSEPELPGSLLDE